MNARVAVTQSSSKLTKACLSTLERLISVLRWHPRDLLIFDGLGHATDGALSRSHDWGLRCYETSLSTRRPENHHGSSSFMLDTLEFSTKFCIWSAARPFSAGLSAPSRGPRSQFLNGTRRRKVACGVSQFHARYFGWLMPGAFRLVRSFCGARPAYGEHLTLPNDADLQIAARHHLVLVARCQWLSTQSFASSQPIS
jgi:hypothetical protein